MKEEELRFEIMKDLLPEGWEEKARETGAITRSRKIKTAGDLLAMILLYLTSGESYSKTAAMTQASEGGLRLTKNAVFERFMKCGEWLAWINSHICRHAQLLAQKPQWLEGKRVCLIDATEVSKPGSNNADWCLHSVVDLFSLDTVEMHLTHASEGEMLTRFKALGEGDLVVGDRGYGTLKALEYAMNSKADYCLRLKSNAFNLYDYEGRIVNLPERIGTMEEGESVDYALQCKINGQFTPIRLCVYRKTSEQEKKNERKIKKSNNGHL